MVLSLNSLKKKAFFALPFYTHSLFLNRGVKQVGKLSCKALNSLFTSIFFHLDQHKDHIFHLLYVLGRQEKTLKGVSEDIYSPLKINICNEKWICKSPSFYFGIKLFL